MGRRNRCRGCYATEEDAKTAILVGKIRSTMNGGSHGTAERRSVPCEACGAWRVVTRRRHRGGETG